ncbi:MAG: Wzz/FepE/Etk N-terminal domain-containing protein, partial [Acidimicrobiia bacterium]
MDLAEHFRLMWQSRWLILVVAFAVALITYGWSATQSDVYQSKATIDALPSPAVRGGEITADEVDVVSERLAALASTTKVLRDAIDRSGLEIGLSTARGRVSADTGAAGFVTIRAEGPSADAARRLAHSVVNALNATARGRNAIEIVSPARTPSGPAEPAPARNALLAFLITLIVTAELAALAGVLAGRLPAGRAREAVELLTDAPVLARIPGSGDRAALR